LAHLANDHRLHSRHSFPWVPQPQSTVALPLPLPFLLPDLPPFPPPPCLCHTNPAPCLSRFPLVQWATPVHLARSTFFFYCRLTSPPLSPRAAVISPPHSVAKVSFPLFPPVFFFSLGDPVPAAHPGFQTPPVSISALSPPPLSLSLFFFRWRPPGLPFFMSPFVAQEESPPPLFTTFCFFCNGALPFPLFLVPTYFCRGTGGFVCQGCPGLLVFDALPGSSPLHRPHSSSWSLGIDPGMTGSFECWFGAFFHFPCYFIPSLL